MSMENNKMKMREALVKARKAICHHAEYVCQSLSWENNTINANCGDVLCAHRDLCEAKTAINKALSLPRLNCEVGTADEQAERFEEYCQSRWECREDCPIGKIIGKNDSLRDHCQLLWAQMPYSEEGIEN